MDAVLVKNYLSEAEMTSSIFGAGSEAEYNRALDRARQVLGQAKVKELKTFRSWASGDARLNHSPIGPSLIFPKAKP